MPLGYSSAGTIVALGPGMDGFHIGQRVACAGGNYAVHAEYNLMPRNLLTPLPDKCRFRIGRLHHPRRDRPARFSAGRTAIGENVAVIGLGLLGLLTIQLASAAGCRVWGVDTNPERVALASNSGFHWKLLPSKEPWTPPRPLPPTAASTASSSAPTPPRTTRRTGWRHCPRPGQNRRHRRGRADLSAQGLLRKRTLLHQLALLRPRPLRPKLRRKRQRLPHRLHPLDGGTQLSKPCFIVGKVES
jgi:hypothetical protein